MRPRHLCLGCRMSCASPSSRRTSFNEAEASLPRMRREPFCFGPPGGAVASMRPRHLCLGCEASQQQWPDAYYSFNEAEASLPRMLIYPPKKVRLEKCFNEAEASLPRMQPIRCSNGSTPSVASMRPRHLCLGCRSSEVLMVPLVLLQ